MKEATGELNMTVITIIAIAAVGALFYVFVWPMIQKSIVTQTCKTYGTDWVALQTDATSINGISNNTGSNAQVKVWVCCPAGEQSTSSKCVTADYGKTN